MSNVLQKENIIMSLPHRDWSCEVIECRLKVCPVPDELDRGNNIFFIVEDLYQLRENSESLNVLGQILAKRFPHIPPKRMHLVLHRRDVQKAHGVAIHLYRFMRSEKENNRSILLKFPRRRHTPRCAFSDHQLLNRHNSRHSRLFFYAKKNHLCPQIAVEKAIYFWVQNVLILTVTINFNM